MWKYAVVAAALAAAAGGCEDRTTRPTTTGRVDNERETARPVTTPPATRGEVPPPAAVPDTEFLRQAVSINTLEVELAEIAKDNSENPDVRAFAEIIARDHEQAAERLKEVTDQIKVEHPDDMLAEHKTLVERMKALDEGPAFDREFVRAMVEGHQKAIDLYQREASQGQNQALKMYAQSTLPTLQMHLRHAQELHRKVSGGVTGAEPGGPPMTAPPPGTTPPAPTPPAPAPGSTPPSPSSPG